MLTQATIDRIRRAKGGKYPVLSVYLNLAPDIREVRSVAPRLKDMLRPISRASEGLDRAAAQSLRADVQTVFDQQKRIDGDLGHGVAIFTCHGTDLFEYLSLPRKLWDKAVANATPYVRPLAAVLDEFHRYCAVVVDRRRSWIFESYMGEMEAHEETIDAGVRKSNFGGWYGLAEYGVRRHAEEMSHRHYRETVKLINDLFEERRFDLLLLGGHRHAVDELVPFLPAHLLKRLAGRFLLDPHTMTPAIVQRHCARLEIEYERRIEAEVVSQLLTTVAERGPAVLGLHRVLDAANARAINLLLVDDDVSAPGVACDACGWLGLSGEICPVCGSPARGVPDVIDELTEVTIDEGGAVEHVFARTPLARHGVGAMARFTVPPLAS